ncbi:MAG TPA: anhydro-N-acetylmuramic acid kinase [Gammaproteobacteria bacterium]|nr:anhydro-N-acetylmuramic acid kinase [Gammaproteobacteria bacterium]HET7586791.1 anhydro-N-acetylmuramic acid kinase [Gammaproteobacteria bacterium]
MAASLYIGLMSGTSADGVEAALVSIDDERIQLRHACYEQFAAELHRQIHALARGDYADGDPIDALGTLDVRLGEAFAAAALRVIAEAGVEPVAVRAIGSHGQTIRHRPDGPAPFTLQIGDPNVIAARTGIATAADFRRRDVALGGQGAPLTPAFHQAAFASPDETRAVLNLGGIANVTLLEPGRSVRGFDIGPANTLLDAWAARHGQGRIDKDGALALAGSVRGKLLQTLLKDEYFRRPPPKSSGPEHFNLQWLDAVLGSLPERPSPEDVQATLVELTARTVAHDLHGQTPSAGRVYVCGGGVHNPALMAALRRALPAVAVLSTAELGVDPDYVEAMAFAWLAHRTVTGKAGNLAAVTGAREAAVLGIICPGVS